MFQNQRKKGTNLNLLAVGFALPVSHDICGELLPRLFNLACAMPSAVYFLLHFPSVLPLMVVNHYRFFAKFGLSSKIENQFSQPIGWAIVCFCVLVIVKHFFIRSYYYTNYNYSPCHFLFIFHLFNGDKTIIATY